MNNKEFYLEGIQFDKHRHHIMLAWSVCRLIHQRARKLTWKGPTMEPRVIQPRSPPERALSSLYCSATVLNFWPFFSCSIASNALLCFSHKMWRTSKVEKEKYYPPSLQHLDLMPGQKNSSYILPFYSAHHYILILYGFAKKLGGDSSLYLRAKSIAEICKRCQ